MGDVFNIEILSPTHIGNGNTLKPMDIGEHDGYVYIFNLDKVIEKIPENRLDEFTELIADFGSKNKITLGDMLSNRFGIKPDQWDSISLYKVKKTDSGRIHDIYEEMKFGNRVYMPGSSIKGVIRTAVIYQFLKEEGYRFSIEQHNRIKYLQMVKPNGQM